MSETCTFELKLEETTPNLIPQHRK